ncbi:unnamed protein product [Prorocentrum cordatum]|uniref:Uncharacterized protein n=1 Tax=Prorocentrum cordatum TaxID=2364126 RepID=A0ABN9TXA6_9DINO|nr:unnamed protein product [Polarella glacialis]
MAAPKWRLPKRSADGEAAGAPALGKAEPPPPRQGGGAAAGSGGPSAAAASGQQENAAQDKGDHNDRKRHQGKVKDMVFNKKQAAINVMIKQVLLTTQMVRDLWAAGLDAFFMGADAPEVAAASDCGVTYSHEVRARVLPWQCGSNWQVLALGGEAHTSRFAVALRLEIQILAFGGQVPSRFAAARTVTWHGFYAAHCQFVTWAFFFFLFFRIWCC